MWTSRRLPATWFGDIGYDRAKYGFDCDTCAVHHLHRRAVPGHRHGRGCVPGEQDRRATPSSAIGAGDQGMMFGYACDETPELMPLPHLAGAQAVHERLAAGAQGRHARPTCGPDGKSQVTVEYDEDDRPVRVDAVVISTQHDARRDIGADPRRHDRAGGQARCIPARSCWMRTRSITSTRPAASSSAARSGDSGLTGRKIIVDTYGGMRPSRRRRVLRQGSRPRWTARAAYAARYVAKNIVAAGLARRCEVQLAYAIGVAQPVSHPGGNLRHRRCWTTASLRQR